MNIREAAAELGIQPKALRRVLRANPAFGGVGMGNTYNLTPDQVERLRKVIPTAGKANTDFPFPELDQTKGFPVRDLRRMRRDPELRARVLEQRAARQRRLLDRLADPEVAAFCASVRDQERAKEAATWLTV